MAGARIAIEGLKLTAELAGGRQEIPALWLRERAVDEASRDVTTTQRLFNPHLLPDDLALTEVREERDGSEPALWLAFSDGYSGRFPLAWLLSELEPDDGLPAERPWDAGLQPLPTFDWAGLADERAFFACLEAYLTYGFAVLRGTPTERTSIEQIAARFGHIRDTNFGRLFEVYARPHSNDLAYRAIALGPHTDNPYREPVPGIQLLHCLVNETSGGLSTLVDSLAVCQTLQQEEPEGYALLGSVPVRFHWIDKEAEFVADRPVLRVDSLGRLTGLTYSPKLDYVPMLSESDTRAYQRARKRLAELLVDRRYELRFRLQPGELTMFDNNRVLHGRTGYDPSEGMRHLMGCYIDRDGPRSHYLVLRRRFRAAAASSPRAAE